MEFVVSFDFSYEGYKQSGIPENKYAKGKPKCFFLFSRLKICLIYAYILMNLTRYMFTKKKMFIEKRVVQCSDNALT